MDAGMLYGLLVLAVLGLSWASGDHILQKLGLILLVAWASTSVAVAYMGFERAPLIIPSIHAALALFAAILGHKRRDVSPKLIFFLYCVMIAFDLGSYAYRIEGTYTYYATLNVLFIAQLLSVGGISAWLALRHGIPAGRQRFRAGDARGKDLD